MHTKYEEILHRSNRVCMYFCFVKKIYCLIDGM